MDFSVIAIKNSLLLFQDLSDEIIKAYINFGERELQKYLFSIFYSISSSDNYPDKTLNEIYDYAYQTTYKCSFPALADLQRHRSLDYFIDSKSLEDFISGECRRYFIPEIIKDDRKLVDEWLLDLAKKSVDDIPQGALITTCESGNFETFMLRAKERICTCAQRDVMNIVRNKTIDYANALKKKVEETNSENYKNLYDKILPDTKGARCMAGYKCATPCGFGEGITCTRKI